METVTLTIDGRQLTVEKGKTVLQAAIEHGIKVPYYCYHPGLGIDGSCRVCLVKIEKMPKLQTACSTPAAEGMVVMTETPDVVEARASVFEFLLINHPLDCPVCDKGGECPLQDFSYSFGPNESRMEFPRRVFDGEGVKADVDFGPTLMLNRNRCILCTRCVRFMSEVDGDAQISIVDRGNGSEIATFQEEGVHSLLSGNLMDVCPVGAITTRDYRFKSRPWDNPDAVDTICTLLREGLQHQRVAQGQAGVGEGRAAGAARRRATTRRSTTTGCATSAASTTTGSKGTDRLRTALVRGAGGELQPAEPREALAKIAERVDAGGGTGTLRFLVSAHASIEELFLLGRMGGAFGLPEDGVAISWRTRRQAAAGRLEVQDSAGRRAEREGRARPRVPGQVGRRRRAGPGGASGSRSESGAVKALFVFDPGPAGSIGDVSWVIDAQEVRQAAAADRAGRADDRPGPRRRRRPARRLLVREGRRLREPAGPAAGRRAGRSPRRATRRKTGRSSCNLAMALGATLDYTAAAQVRADVARALAGNATYAGLAQLVVRPAGGGEALAAGVEPVRTLEVGRHVPGPAAGEVRHPARPDDDSVRGDSVTEGRLNQNVTLLAAFAAGFLSFVSPCVLPLIPGYISFVSGVSMEDMRGDVGGAVRPRARRSSSPRSPS